MFCYLYSNKSRLAGCLQDEIMLISVTQALYLFHWLSNPANFTEYMKIAATVILYHPTDEVVENIKTYYDHVEKIYVFDNTESPSPVKEKLAAFPKIEFYQDLKNEGISKRLNQGCTKAIADGFDWALTMDQDTTFSAENIQYYFNCIDHYSKKDQVAMFGTKYGRNDEPSFPECKAKETDALITSGSMLNLKLFSIIGDFDENLFIDSVDHEYCVRAATKGYQIIEMENIYLKHHIGQEVYRSSIKTLFLIKKKKELHSPLRCYYMYRNMLYLEDKYKHTDVAFTRLLRGYVTSYIKKYILYGRNTIKTLKYVALAKNDFKTGNMGKIKRLL